MMRSSMNDNTEDDFAPNPFRSNTDFLDAAPAPVVDPFAAQPPPQHHHQQQQFQQPHQQQYAIDTNSGMHGSLNVPPPHLQHQQQPAGVSPMAHEQQQMQSLTGSMDNAQNSKYGSTQDNQPPQSLFSWRGLMACCKMDNLAQLFDVDSIDIYHRLKGSLLKFHEPNVFRTSIIGDSAAPNVAASNDTGTTGVPVNDRKGPDLYGPFWISMTLMFVLGVTANLSGYMHHKRKSTVEDFEYDINHLLKAMYIVSVCSFCLPTAFWLTCQCLGMPTIAWSMWTCVYGYSMVPICAGALAAWWLPYELWHWLVLAGSVGCSGMLVVRNLATPLLAQDAEANHAKAAPLLLAILGAHVCILLTLKVSFYP